MNTLTHCNDIMLFLIYLHQSLSLSLSHYMYIYICMYHFHSSRSFLAQNCVKLKNRKKRRQKGERKRFRIVHTWDVPENRRIHNFIDRQCRLYSAQARKFYNNTLLFFYAIYRHLQACIKTHARDDKIARLIPFDKGITFSFFLSLFFFFSPFSIKNRTFIVHSLKGQTLRVRTFYLIGYRRLITTCNKTAQK